MAIHLASQNSKCKLKITMLPKHYQIDSLILDFNNIYVSKLTKSPQNIPPIISKGKCTPKYTLLYPIIVAQENKNMNILIFFNIILTKKAIANEFEACELINEYKPPHSFTILTRSN